MSISGNWDRRVSRKAFLGIGGLSVAAHERCLDIHPCTVNEKQEMKDLISLGVDGMFTNFPDRLDQVLGKSAAPGTTGAGMAADASLVCRSELGG